MQYLSLRLLSLSLAALATAAPSKTIVERADLCGQWDSIQTGTYTVYNNLWGRDQATGGSQCFGVDSASGSTVRWHATWTWTGGQGHVKSYPNAVVNFTPKTLSSIRSMKTSWAWTYSGSNVIANVAYDLFTSSSATGSAQYEIMIWLAAFGGAGPISSNYGSDGNAVPVATVNIDGVSWKLYKGLNGSMTVFSFVASSTVASFSGDLKNFVNYLTSNQGLSTSQYLQSVGAGTEPFEGSGAKFAVSSYSVVIA